MNVKLIGEHKKDSRACRDGLALTLNEMMAEDKSICYVDCDLMGCINTKMLRKNYPDRAFEAGIAEGNAAGISAGLAATGKKVFFHSFGTFSSRRCYDQIYMSAAYAGLTVHVLGSDAGVTAAFNGGTHMPLEDGGMYLSIPESTVLDPADYAEMEGKLADVEWFRETYELRAPDTVRAIWDEVVVPAAWGVRRSSKGGSRRSMFPWNCRGCQFRELCQAELRGYDADDVRQRQYTRKEHRK